MNNDCSASISDPVSDYSVTQSCDSWRAVRGFLVLAIITSALALLAIYLATFSKLPYLPLRAPALLLSFIAGLFGLVAWAIFLSISRDNTGYTANSEYVSRTAQLSLLPLSATASALSSTASAVLCLVSPTGNTAMASGC